MCFSCVSHVTAVLCTQRAVMSKEGVLLTATKSHDFLFREDGLLCGPSFAESKVTGHC